MTATDTPPEIVVPPRPPSRLRRRILILFACIVVGIPLCLVAYLLGAGWRGERAWKKTRAELEARGEKLDWKSFIPPEVPAAGNFAMTPYFEGLRYRQGEPAGQADSRLESFAAIEKEAGRIVAADRRGRGKGSTTGRQPTDLGAWEKAFRKGPRPKGAPREEPVEAGPVVSRAVASTVILEGLKAYDPVLNELAAAARRPASRFPLEYDKPDLMNVLLPHLARTKPPVKILGLRAVVSLEADNGDRAAQDVLLMLRLSEVLKDEPFLISHLVRLSTLHLTLNTLWECLLEGGWTAAELESLQRRLESVDVLGEGRQALRGERVFGLSSIAFLRDATVAERAGFLGQGDQAEGSAVLGGRLLNLVPDGWFDYEMASYAQLFDRMMPPPEVFEQRYLDPKSRAAQLAEFEAALRPPLRRVMDHQMFAALLLPALDKAITKSAVAQVMVDQAVVALALERYFLAHQQYPERLAALVPSQLARVPRDLFANEPINYERTADGRYRIFSVGKNGQDDGGKADGEADIVWEYPRLAR